MTKKGWKRESARHALARKGIKTGQKIPISAIHTVKTYVSPEGFSFEYEPIEDTITVVKTKDGYVAKYLVLDTDAESPNADEDDNLFLVHYHRDFDVRRKEIITEDDPREWYQGKKIPQEKKYWIFPVEAYIHSGVALTLNTFRGRLPQGHYEFDVSHVGLVLASKDEFKTREQAIKCAGGLVDNWNTYLSGNVYGIVREVYDNSKNKIDYDAVWGYYGSKSAMDALKKFGGVL